MQYQWINLSLAFLEGFALIASPCILPILPILFAGVITSDKGRIWGIMLGFVLVFTFITSFARILVQYLGINPDFLRYAGFVLILIFGLILLSEKLSQWFNRYSQWISHYAENLNNPRQEGFIGGIILGGSLSLIWTPCAGPILATALVQSALQRTFLDSLLVLFFFALGSVIPMVCIAFLGKWIVKQFLFLKMHTLKIRKIMGFLMIAGAFFALFGNRLTQYTTMKIAPNVLVPTVKSTGGLIAPLSQPYPAPNFQGIDQWINSAPLTMEQLKGKVVLIDFWTYSCINCIRSIPELNRLYAQYRDKGLEIIGVHTPEFEFEKNPNNVMRAVEENHILYPVALDNNYGTWISYHNLYWPAQYLIDQNGMVVYQKFGEGNEEITEHNILTLLNMPTYQVSGQRERTSLNNQFDALQTPEIYLGYVRSAAYGGAVNVVPNTMSEYAIPINLPKDSWALSGLWKINGDRIVSGKLQPTIQLHFFAGKVYAVMGSETENPIAVKILFNDEPIANKGGKDVKDNQVIVSQYGLYELVSLPEPDVGIISLQPEDPGLAIYTFTFGS